MGIKLYQAPLSDPSRLAQKREVKNGRSVSSFAMVNVLLAGVEVEKRDKVNVGLVSRRARLKQF